MEELEEGVGGYDMAVDQVGEEPQDVTSCLPVASLQRFLELPSHQVNKLKEVN